MIATSADIELNPGPRQIKYPCGTCGKAVTWRQEGIRCDNSDCAQWYHIDCQNMRSTIYEHMDASKCSWECLKCAMPNFSYSLFDLHDISTHNSFSTFENSKDESTDILSPGPPLASSSPHKKSAVKTRKQKPLRIININCQSIGNKHGQFEHLLDSTKADIVFGTESWLNNNIKDHEVFPDGYAVYRKDRKAGRGRGVFVAVKEDLVSSHMVEFDTECEIIWVKLSITSCRNLYVASYYRPHVSDQESLDKLDESLSKVPKNNSHIWIAGDMNLPGLNWPEGNLKTNCPYPEQHDRFTEILADHGLIQLIDKPTREENTLDLLAVNNPTLLNRTEVIPGISDHVVFAELDVAPRRHKQVKRRVPIYRRAEWSKIEEVMMETHQEIQAQSKDSDVETTWDTFKSRLSSAVSNFVPHRSTSARDRPPWITLKVKKLIQARNRLSKKLKNKSTGSRQEKLKSLKKAIQKATKEAYWSYTETIITESETKSNNKKLWTFIKHKKTDSVDIAPLKENGLLKDSPKDQAEILNNQFSSVFTTDRPSDFPDHTPFKNNKKYPDIEDIHISVDGVEKLLNDLNPHKSMGPDGLHPKVLRQLSSTIAPMLQLIFQTSVTTGQVPSDWKKANVCPIFKKGERYDPANYRPVSLTCICSKLLEHIITKHLLLHLNRNNILNNNQHGFRSGRSTETQLIAFTQDVLQNHRSGQQTDIVIMDFAKAFDKVSHWRLAIKLRNYGVTGSVNKWIANFLDQRTQRVVCKGEHSGWAPVLSGVP